MLYEVITDAEGRGALAPHAERIGVAEAEPPRKTDAAGRERGAKRVLAGERGPAVAGQDLVRDGAGIFRVDVDFAGQEGVPQDPRAAEPGAVAA